LAEESPSQLLNHHLQDLQTQKRHEQLALAACILINLGDALVRAFTTYRIPKNIDIKRQGKAVYPHTVMKLGFSIHPEVTNLPELELNNLNFGDLVFEV
jgi:hypothetical protein